MSLPVLTDFCARVREALISGCFDQCQREVVNRHLAEHPACNQWATEHLLLTHILAGQRGHYQAPALAPALEAYVAGRLSASERLEVEMACSHDLDCARRLNALQEQQLRRRISLLNPRQWSAWMKAAATETCASLRADLEEFRALYLLKPALAAAAQSQRSVYQTSDGALVVSVVDRGAEPAPGSRQIELGLRVHEPGWIGRWGLYRIVDAQGNLGAAGVVKLEEQGSLVQVTVPPSRHEPYSVQVEILEMGTVELEQALDRLEAGGDS